MTTARCSDEGTSNQRAAGRSSAISIIETAGSRDVMAKGEVPDNALYKRIHPTVHRGGRALDL